MTNTDGGGFGIGIFVGVAVGLAVGLLYAPRSGRETRALIREKAEVGIDKAEEYRERAREIVDDARRRADEIIQKAQSKAAEIRKGREPQEAA